MSQTDEQKALSEIGTKINEVYKLIKECEEIAERAGVEFSLDVAYGMGGTYVPKKIADEETWTEQGWNASSQSC